jgi:hypothetical protein
MVNLNKAFIVRCEGLTAVTVKMAAVFWVVAPCRLV